MSRRIEPTPDGDSRREGNFRLREPVNRGVGEKESAMKPSNILRALTIQEWAIVVVIVLVLLALLVPNVRWVADGERSHPVRVFVFDASNDRPIVGARVTIFHAAPLSSVETMSKRSKGSPPSGTAIPKTRSPLRTGVRSSSTDSRPAPAVVVRRLTFICAGPGSKSVRRLRRRGCSRSTRISTYRRCFAGIGTTRPDWPASRSAVKH